MIPKNIPDDINAELLFSYFPKGSCKALFKGQHKRNAYSDIIDVEEPVDGTLYVSIGRDSLYNSLPEFMFHPIDRFNEIPKSEEKERFAQEYAKQEKEKEHAYKFFAPIDSFLLQLRITARVLLNDYYESNKVLIDTLADSVPPELRENRFIKQLLPFLPSCKHIRGDKTLMTMMLRKIFIEEGLTINVHREDIVFTDDQPRYPESIGAPLDSCYLGNVFTEQTTVYDIHYWSYEQCDEQFMTFIKEVDELRDFLQDYFMSVDEILTFNICNDDESSLILNDDLIYNYLNYNTNL